MEMWLFLWVSVLLNFIFRTIVAYMASYMGPIFFVLPVENLHNFKSIIKYANTEQKDQINLRMVPEHNVWS